MPIWTLLRSYFRFLEVDYFLSQTEDEAILVPDWLQRGVAYTDGKIVIVIGDSMLEKRLFTIIYTLTADRKIPEEGNDYFTKKEYHSSALDILATYLRGQKLIYMESKTYCETRLNYLMMPAIMLSTVATVLSPITNDYTWGMYILAGINGIIAFLLTVVNYLKHHILPWIP